MRRGDANFKFASAITSLLINLPCSFAKPLLRCCFLLMFGLSSRDVRQDIYHFVEEESAVGQDQNAVVGRSF